MSTAQQKPRLLIVGAGIAGTALAQECSPFMDVTLVDPKGYMELTWATVRGIVNADVASRACFDYEDIPGKGTFIQAAVTRLTSKDATLSTGQVLSFDYAALCTGAAYGSAAFKSDSSATREQRLEEMKAVSERIRTARSVVVVGGGPAGVEAASEVAEAFAGKTITLIHPGKALLPALPARAGALAARWLQAHKIKVLLETKVVPSSKPSEGLGPATLQLSDGSSLEADVVLWCAGSQPCSAYLAEDLAGACRDERGLIKVLPSLQVEGHPHLFALGDVTNVPEAKLGFLAKGHAGVVAGNLKALISSPGSSGKARSGGAKLRHWTPNMGVEVMLVTLGRYDAVCRLGGWAFSGWLPAAIKSKGLFVDKYRNEFKVGKAGSKN